MKRVQTGRVQWMCMKCYRNADTEVHFSAGVIKRRKIVREEKNRR
jgi:hypothetical protein